MSIELSESIKKVLADKAYGHVVTVNPDGSPQMTMVWVDVDGNDVLFNTGDGGVKVRNLRRDPRIVISVQDRNAPQTHAVFHGNATVTAEGADQHIDKLAKRFLGLDTYPWRTPGRERLIVRTKVGRIGGVGT
jgi:PPOX class probable F420-dependent enzyme